MNIKTERSADTTIALVQDDQLLITDTQSALDLIATVRYEIDCDSMAVNKSAVAEEFFRLSSGLAGDILQKFTNYQMKLAIIGDFSCYSSKPLKDFIYESNQGNHIFFVSDEAEAIEKLSKTK